MTAFISPWHVSSLIKRLLTKVKAGIMMGLPEYWMALKKTDLGWAHPEDLMAFRSSQHSFNLDFPPPAFVGDILNARLIVLAANGGYKKDVTSKEFAAPGSEDRYMERLTDPSHVDWSEVAPYYRGINYADLVFSGAAVIVNACAYRSPKISNEPENRKLIERLSSVRFTRRWLLETIFPEAEAGQRLIIGKRHGLWNLPQAVKKSRGFIACVFRRT